VKLPQDKKTRQQVIGLMAVGIVAILYGVWMFIYQPVVEKRKDSIQKTGDLNTAIADAERQIARLPAMERDLMTITLELSELSERYMLHARLGNYLIPAREIINRHARALNIDNVQIDEIGLIAMPRPREGDRRATSDRRAARQPAGTKAPPPPAPATMQAYAVRITVRSSFDDLRAWIKLMEEENPLLSISNLMITGRREDPLKHAVTFEVQWPAWVDPDFRDTLLYKAGETSGEQDQ
jgi:hypothetical protein